MRTELARVQVEAQLQVFRENEIEQYEYVACYKSCACNACKGLDGKHFNVKDSMPGENAPPMHPNCHCSVCGYLDEAEYNEWLDTYKEHGLSYKEWRESGNDGIIKTERNKFKRGRYPATQEKIDDIIQNELSGVLFSVAPIYNSRIATPGKTSIELYSWGEFKKVNKIEIGKQYKDTKESLIDTLLHEELEARLAKRYGSKMYDMADDEIHEYIDRVIERFFKMKGLEHELV